MSGISLESRIKEFCTSTLAHLTAGSIFNVKDASYPQLEKELEQVKKILRKRQFDLTVLKNSAKGNLVYVYNPEKLLQNLEDKNSMEILKSFGYKKSAGSAMIEQLKQRFFENGGFPHEIGLFLGYPPEDVLGFIKNNGENYLYSGYWKVYANPDSRKQLFNKITKCRKILPKTLGLDQSLDFLAEFY